MQRILVVTTMLLGLLSPNATAQSTEADVSARLVGKQLFLRGMWGDDKLKFDANGKPEDTYIVHSFTEDGFVPESVSLKDGKLKISGHRFGLLFDEKGEMQHAKLEKMTLEVDGNAGMDLAPALDAVFANGLANLVPTMPYYWHKYAVQHFMPTDAAATTSLADDSTTSTEKPLPIGGSVEKPILLTHVDPVYTKAARKQKLSGTVKVYAWIEKDGRPSHVAIIKPVGLGLDDQAALLVSHYQFKPAMQNGKPVVVELWVDVSFDIY